jgi:hypothetical protein
MDGSMTQFHLQKQARLIGLNISPDGVNDWFFFNLPNPSGRTGPWGLFSP